MKRVIALMKSLAQPVRRRCGMVVDHLRCFLESDRNIILTQDEIEDRFEQSLRCGF